MVDKYYAYFDKIGGSGIIFEVDEIKFGKRKYERGHKVESVCILGAVERSNDRRIILKSCKTGSMNELECFLTTFVKMNSVIFSDGWRGYSNIKNFLIDHKVVYMQKGFVYSTTGTHINTVEGCWSAIKKIISFRHRTRKLIDIYLLRFIVNRNEKNASFDFFYKINFLKTIFFKLIFFKKIFFL
ncbi:hypothetical protein DMUE_3587 [Dictyocoela muelleri]|nr:hypothetical protein DMUE_3587 [Dictyocoela muelleri]